MQTQTIKSVFEPSKHNLVSAPEVEKSSQFKQQLPQQNRRRLTLIAGTSLVAMLLITGLVATQLGVYQSQDQRSQAAADISVSAAFPTGEMSVVSGTAARTQVYIQPAAEVIPTAAEIVLTYDPNALQITDISAGKDFPLVLVAASNDDQSGVATITVAREPNAPISGSDLSAVSIAFQVKPESTNTKLSIDNASQVAAVGTRENVLRSTAVLRIVSDAQETSDSLEDRSALRERLQEDPGKITSPLPTPIVVPGTTPKPIRPEPSFEPIPPQL